MWSTKDELSFIQGLGHWHNWATPAIGRGMRIVALRGYIEAAPHREWGNVDPEVCISTAKNCLAQATAASL